MMHFKKIILASFFLSSSLYAADLKIVEGQASSSSTEDCGESKFMDEAIQKARQNALEQIDISKYRQISNWRDLSLPINNYGMCHYIASSTASFVLSNEISEKWYISLYAHSSTLDKPEFEDNGWTDAFAHAKQLADYYCNGKSEEPFLSEKIKISVEPGFWRKFTVKISTICM